MRKPIKLVLCGGLLGLVGLMGSVGVQPVMAQNAQWNALFDRIIRLEAKVKAMSQRGVGAGGGAPVAGSNAQMRQILNEIRGMRQELLNMDARIRRLEAGGRSGRLSRPVPRQPVTRYQPTTPAPQTGYNPNDIREYETPQITTQIGDPVPGSQPGRVPFARAPGVRTPTAPVTSVPKAPGKVVGLPQPQAQSGVIRQTLDGNQITEKSVAKRLYDRASSDFRARRFGAAESGFKSFVRKYGKDALASNAQFMLGETYYVQKNYRLAAQAYLQGYRKYPRGRRSADTLLKLGMSLQKLGQKSQACGAYERVISQYKSARSTVTRAKKELRRSGC